MNFLQRIFKAKKTAKNVETTRTLAKTMQEERIMKVPEVVKNIGLKK